MYNYTISAKLLKNIKEITRQIVELEHRKFSDPVLANYQLSAISLSAHSSTSIEGNPLPLTEVKKILKNRPTNVRTSEREVLNYNDCLVWLNQDIKSSNIEFNIKLILKIHMQVMRGLLTKGNLGKIRVEPVFVNSPQKRKTIYWPPDHGDVGKLMKQLFEFVEQNRDDLDPIILAGIFHKQFVIIHPFIDGNGRTVRLATKVLLAKLGFNTFHLFSFENYYNRHVTKYFERVGVLGNYYDIVDKLDFTEWLEYFTDGILDELLRVRKDLELAVQTPEQILSTDQQKIMSYLQKQGFIRDKDYAKITDRAKATRALDFRKLLDLGLIDKLGRGPAVYYKLR